MCEADSGRRVGRGREGEVRVTRGEFAGRILASRRGLAGEVGKPEALPAAEGGCGVLGLASSVPVAGRHVIEAAAQMHNRGNGKGGGIAMAGLDPAQMGVSPETLRDAYLIQIAYLDPAARGEVEREGLADLEIIEGGPVPMVADWQAVEGLEVEPPQVWRYFARVEGGALDRFAAEAGLERMDSRAVEDEFVYQNSFRLNTRFYASLGEQRAFVLSHSRDLMVLKIVGYAEQVIEIYGLDDVTAHVWIAHQRYPTKGRVWHPGGAHPFVGLNEALVHNGDFANYHAVSEYLRQRNIAPLFLTDTEVSVQLFDLWDRVYDYPLEVTLEALAPTTERDFDVLAPEKQRLYRAVQATHLHASPDGPWFFIIARSHPDRGEWELLGITDTSMLRPQVFAHFENDRVELGMIASERQAIHAAMRSLAAEDGRFLPRADAYWVARGGSHTDGGAFTFTVREDRGTMGSATTADGAGDGVNRCCSLHVANKFGEPVVLPEGQRHVDRARLDPKRAGTGFKRDLRAQVYRSYDNGGARSLLGALADEVSRWTYEELASATEVLVRFGKAGSDEWRFARDALTLLLDRRLDPGEKRRASVVTLVADALLGLFDEITPLARADEGRHAGRIAWEDRDALRAPRDGEKELLIDARGFPPEGVESAARLVAEAYELGWRRLTAFDWRGGRFAACGLGRETGGVRVDLYGDVGDYAASGIDGAEVHIHGDAQDQVGQIFKDGKLIVHGDVGQTFLYGAKGGTIFVAGSAAGRPLINAVGRPRVVINGTCLDYLAESFMAGDPLKGGGFVVLNGVAFDERGRLREMETPYPGGNLFSLASGGAVYLRDPRKRVETDQLNGGRFAPLSEADWDLIEPYLAENERLFGICLEALLTVDRRVRSPMAVYRKVVPQDRSFLR